MNRDYASLVAVLGRKNSQDAWHIYTAEKHNLFCFLTMDFKLVTCLEAQKNAPRIRSMKTAVMTPAAFIDHAESLFAALGADVRHGGNQAYYTMAEDRVQMPPLETFRDAESYYATLAHECTHWTRHPSRLERDFGRKRWGDEGYAMEELVADLASAFLSADLDLTPETRPDHAAYIGSWLKVLKNDKRAIFTAASHAQRAADFLHGLQEERRVLEAAE